MYLQITTKCNMTCDHCCYSCRPGKGQHMPKNILDQAIYFTSQWDDVISIGGGEPTLHPDFFDILETCINNFSSVWMATNGSQTSKMYRLADIINGTDYPECTCDYPDDCSCVAEGIYGVDKLAVALSQDYWHDPINPKIVDLWERNKWETRNVAHSNAGAAAQGRAKRTGAGWSDHCVCPDFIIRPDGKIKICGCTHSPIIGDVFNGIKSEWLTKIENENLQDSRCYKAFKK